MARTYDSALSHLALLQSNRAITSLFAPPPPSSSSSSSSKPPDDLNALAIPEMLAWLERAGLSRETLASSPLRCVHVAGTKGKGSVCAYLTSILTRPEVRARAGRVGTYTSPHLVSVRERIQLDGAPVGRDLFARYFFEVWDAFSAAARAEALAAALTENGKGVAMLSEEEEKEIEGPATKPFYFRFLTVLALRVFLDEGVRSAVVECGIGGEYDSTNALPPATVTAAVVAQLGIDHVGMLGATLPEIAWHKAGVCREGRKCFTRRLSGGRGGGEEEKETMTVLRRRAGEKKAVLVELDDADVEAWGGVRDPEAGSLQGAFQMYNQALAVCAAREHLRVLGGQPESESGSETQAQAPGGLLAPLPDGFAAGLRQARLRGRCETLVDGDIDWFIDGAHTAESLGEVAGWFAGKWSATGDGGARRVLIFNQQDRDAARLLGGFIEEIRARLGGGHEQTHVFDLAVMTRNELQQAPDPADGGPGRDLAVQQAAAHMMGDMCPQTRTMVLDNVGDAVAEARKLALEREGGGRVGVLVTGSLHLVGALLRTLEPDAEL